MSTHEKVCQNMRKYVKTWESMSKHEKVCQNMRKYVKTYIHTSMQKPAQVCISLHKYAKAYCQRKKEIFFQPFFKFYDDLFPPFFKFGMTFWKYFFDFFQPFLTTLDVETFRDQNVRYETLFPHDIFTHNIAIKGYFDNFLPQTSIDPGKLSNKRNSRLFLVCFVF